MMQINFKADKVSLRGPDRDGGMKITLEVGEYEKESVKELLSLPTGAGAGAGALYDQETRSKQKIQL